MPTFTHSGMVGDIIYSLPAIRELGGGMLRVYSRRARTTMTEELTSSLATLLEKQPYIAGCEYTTERGDVDLDDWVSHYRDDLNLAEMYLTAVNRPLQASRQPWLSVPHPVRAGRIVMHRTSRYRNPLFPWRELWEQYHDDAIMVGHPDEHAAFCAEIGPIQYLPTRGYLELARVIAGCDLFIGNQSSPYAIAEALKIPTIQETSPRVPNCIFRRENACYSLDGSVVAPPIAGWYTPTRAPALGS